jgi:hypothetical protein
VDGAPIGAKVADGLGDGDGDGLGGAALVGATGLAEVVVGGVEVAVAVAVPDPGALAVKNVADADPPALGEPVPVQAETASAASMATMLHTTALSLARTRMEPPDDPVGDRPFPVPA